jgi:hypothetical protein
MGKRSEFLRLERDSYATPAVAVAPLLPWLMPRTQFVEPCVGAGRLVEHLTAAGHLPVGIHDLPDDARRKRYSILGDEVFITNPPFWGRPNDLHPLIRNLSNQAPAWLLPIGSTT